VTSVLVVATGRVAVMVTASSPAVCWHLRHRGLAILKLLSGVLLMMMLVVHDLVRACVSNTTREYRNAQPQEGRQGLAVEQLVGEAAEWLAISPPVQRDARR